MKPVLLSVLPRPTHPTRDGLAIRNYHLLRALGEEFSVRAFVLRAPHLPDGEYPEGVSVEEFRQRPRRVRQASALAGSLVLGGPYSPRLYRSNALAARLGAASAATPAAWVVAHAYHVAPLALASGRPSWIDFHNIDSRIWQRMGESASNGLTRAFASLQAPRVREFERTLLRRAAGISCVSAPDASEILELAPGTAPLVVPNAVDLERYAFHDERPGDGVLLFVGDLSWPPNAEGLRWFADAVWPLVHSRLPRARVEVLGRSVPPDLRRRAPDWTFLGEGGDTRLPWARADAAIVPLRAGGGTRLKILEAAACGVPVVSTTIGAEGLELEAESEILLRDDPPAFADAVVRLLGDRSQRVAIAASARLRVEQRYDWKRVGAQFAVALRERMTP
jgi:glycosyltransferase involved in cell wall biosynthesis